MNPRTQELLNAWRARGRALLVPGANTWVWEEGQGAPVVLLHGVPSSSYLYRKILPALSRRGLRGIALDFPGLGLAERPEEFDYRWSGLSQWLLKALGALRLERFHLVVHDIGGPIGFDLISRAPEKILSLTVLNTLVRAASFQRPWSMEPFARRGIGEIYVAMANESLFPLMMRLHGVKTKVPAEELKVYVPLLKGNDGGRAFLKIMRGFERTAEFEARSLQALKERKFPAQIVWGKDDPALPVTKFGPHLQEALGLDTIHELTGKHFVQEDSPEEVAERIADLAAPAKG